MYLRKRGKCPLYIYIYVSLLDLQLILAVCGAVGHLLGFPPLTRYFHYVQPL